MKIDQDEPIEMEVEEHVEYPNQSKESSYHSIQQSGEIEQYDVTLIMESAVKSITPEPVTHCTSC